MLIFVETKKKVMDKKKEISFKELAEASFANSFIGAQLQVLAKLIAENNKIKNEQEKQEKYGK